MEKEVGQTTLELYLKPESWAILNFLKILFLFILFGEVVEICTLPC